MEVFSKLRKLLGSVHSAAFRSSLDHMQKSHGKSDLIHIEGKLNPADALTKAADAESFKNLMNAVKLRDRFTHPLNPKYMELVAKRKEGRERNQS